MNDSRDALIQKRRLHKFLVENKITNKYFDVFSKFNFDALRNSILSWQDLQFKQHGIEESDITEIKQLISNKIKPLVC